MSNIRPQHPPAANGGAHVNDRRLADDCLAGSESAWNQLFHECQPALLKAIKTYLGGMPSDSDLAEEIASRVWLSLVDNRGRILDRFDPGRGCRLVTFVTALARNELLQHFRTERRRIMREKSASHDCLLQQPSIYQLEAELKDFAVTLTPREKEFFLYHLAGIHNGDGDAVPVSTKSSIWQLRHRVRRKLKAFIGPG